jgi:hypothetical protein
VFFFFNLTIKFKSINTNQRPQWYLFPESHTHIVCGDKGIFNTFNLFSGLIFPPISKTYLSLIKKSPLSEYMILWPYPELIYEKCFPLYFLVLHSKLKHTSNLNFPNTLKRFQFTNATLTLKQVDSKTNFIQ